MGKISTQPQIVPDQAKPTPIYEPIRSPSEEEPSIEESSTREDDTKGKTNYTNEIITEKSRKEPGIVKENKDETYKDNVDTELEETIESFLGDLGCKIQDDWIIDVPTFCSFEWLRRRLTVKLSELGYSLNNNIIYKDNNEILKMNFKKRQPMGKISIIIDDVGRSTKLNKVLEDINLPLNISILPSQNRSKEMSILGRRKGWDVLLHLPMEPKEKSWIDSTFIKVAMSDRDIEERVISYLQELPYVNGINNHMGSLATADERVMRIVLDIVKDRGIYFVDSLTTSDSVGEKISKELGLVRFAKRDIFLDNIDDRSYIESQIEKLIKVGIREGFALGIGHLRENTLLAIKNYNWKDKDVELVLLSEVL